jgi:hypothetical protein
MESDGVSRTTGDTARFSSATSGTTDHGGAWHEIAVVDIEIDTMSIHGSTPGAGITPDAWPAFSIRSA